MMHAAGARLIVAALRRRHRMGMRAFAREDKAGVGGRWRGWSIASVLGNAQGLDFFGRVEEKFLERLVVLLKLVLEVAPGDGVRADELPENMQNRIHW